jgi:uncharacterized protein (UPF0548 family)
MEPTRLIERLRTAPYTYPEVGAVSANPLPAGYHHLRRGAVLGGREHFATAVDDLLHWRMHERAGIRVTASAPVAGAGVVFVQRIGFGPLRIAAPCRVLEVVTGPQRAALTYGTLPGHPECGEERFLVEMRRDGVVTLKITAFSRPASWYARLGGPITSRVQALVTERYLRALRDPRGGDHQ